jgi:hypothetical protein
MRADTEARFRMKVDELEIYLLAFNGKVINTLRTLRGLEALSITSAAKETDSSDLNVPNLIKRNSGDGNKISQQDSSPRDECPANDADWLD